MLAGGDDPVPHAALEACHEGDATGLQLVKPREIEMARSATTTLPASNVHVRATVTSAVLPSVTLRKLGRWPAWSNPMCSLIAAFVRRNDAHGKTARHKSRLQNSRGIGAGRSPQLSW